MTSEDVRFIAGCLVITALAIATRIVQLWRKRRRRSREYVSDATRSRLHAAENNVLLFPGEKGGA